MDNNALIQSRKSQSFEVYADSFAIVSAPTISTSPASGITRTLSDSKEISVTERSNIESIRNTLRELNDSSLSWDRTHYFDESNFRTDVIWDNESDRLVQSIAALNLVEQRQNEMLAYIAKVLPHAVAAKFEGQDAAKLEEDQVGMPNAEFETQPDAT